MSAALSISDAGRLLRCSAPEQVRAAAKRRGWRILYIEVSGRQIEALDLDSLDPVTRNLVVIAAEAIEAPIYVELPVITASRQPLTASRQPSAASRQPQPKVVSIADAKRWVSLTPNTSHLTPSSQGRS